MLSIIIVNYNVKYFLEQCLHSVQRAIAGIETEVMVVDNNSTDGSVEYLQPLFPWVVFIINGENTGYARANNQGWQRTKGEFVLFLNPDTILSEDSLAASLAVFQQQPGVGATGIRMIDGSGRFLPESKRGFPTPAASFYKLSGFIKLFPHTKPFANYYLGHLPADKSHEVDVLAGAFMMIRKSLLQETGGFDEQFFMYGEDIDLSYRIQKAGYKNWYLADSAILHFKGESTRKDYKYTRLFYSAMSIFVKKHYRPQSWWFGILLQAAIRLRGGLSVLSKLIRPAAGIQAAGPIYTIITGAADETAELMSLLQKQSLPAEIIHNAGSLQELPLLLNKYKNGKIIFCNGSISNSIIFKWIQQHAPLPLKFHAAGSRSIIGSSSKSTSGETLAL